MAGNDQDWLVETLKPLFFSRIFIRIISLLGFLIAIQNGLMAGAYGGIGFSSESASLLVKVAFILGGMALLVGTGYFIRASLSLWNRAGALTNLAHQSILPPVGADTVAGQLSVYFHGMVGGLISSVIGFGLAAVSAWLDRMVMG